MQVEKIINDIKAPGPLTRSKASHLSNFCGHYAFVSITEPTKVDEAFLEPEWIQAMQDELQRKSQEYDKNKSTMNATKQQETETELNNLYQKYQQALQDNQQSLAKEQQDKMQPITTKLVNAIKAVGQAGGYVYIMDTSAGIPYISSTLSKDVTADVKAQLNKMK